MTLKVWSGSGYEDVGLGFAEKALSWVGGDFSTVWQPNGFELEFVYGGFTAASSTTIPAHQAGDLVVVIAARLNNTNLPTLPAGWNSAGTVTSGLGLRLGWQVSNGNLSTTGSWTGATGIAVAIWRGVAEVGAFSFRASASTSASIPLPALDLHDGDAVAARAIVTQRTATTSIPDLTNRLSDRISIWDSNGLSNDLPDSSTSASTATEYTSIAFELLPALPGRQRMTKVGELSVAQNPVAGWSSDPAAPATIVSNQMVAQLSGQFAVTASIGRNSGGNGGGVATLYVNGSSVGTTNWATFDSSTKTITTTRAIAKGDTIHLGITGITVAAPVSAANTWIDLSPVRT